MRSINGDFHHEDATEDKGEEVRGEYKFFHNIVNWKRRSNELNEVYTDGSWVKEPCRVKEEVRRFFELKYKDTVISLHGVPFGTIDQSDNSMLVVLDKRPQKY